MSDVLYPVSLIERLVSEKVGRVVSDVFEDGSTSARNQWSAQNFKRRITLTHAPLTEAEFRYLRSFYSQRSGRYDSFWLRDNVHRDGNVKVRFASSLPMEYQGRARRLQLVFEEVAAIRALPEFDELTAAAGNTPLIWLDANRELYYSHAGTVVTESALYDPVNFAAASWQAGSFPAGNITGQYQHYAFTGAEWAKSSANFLTGTQPAATVFCIAKHGTIASKAVLVGVGSLGAGKGLGIAISAANAYEPWIGGSESWSTATQSNATNNTWRSFAVTWAASSNTASFYVNGAAALTETKTRDYATGPISLGAAPDGTLKTTGNVAHALVFPAALTFAQVKAVHNLLGYQYGLSTVA